jgi:hypothetical protein
MRTILLILVLICFCSCGRKSTNEKNSANSVLKIDLLSKPESTVDKLSDISTNVEYIPLQTTGNSFIAPFVLKILNKDKRIYILNSGLNSREILCFDMDGKFLFKLHNEGRGPEEYISITDFDVSSDNKFLIILSEIDHKLIVYGIADTCFTFQRSVSLKKPVPGKVRIIPETDKIFLAVPPWGGTEPTLSLLINVVGDTINFKPNCSKYKLVTKMNYISTDEMLVYSIANMVCFKEEFSDTVFYVDAKDNSFKPRMIFDSHGIQFKPEMRGGSEPIGENTIFIADLFETSKYVIYRSQLKTILFDKMTKIKHGLNIKYFSEKTIINTNVEIPKNILKDDLSGGPDFTMDLNSWDRLCHNGKMFSLVEAITLKNHVASEDFKNARVNESQKAKIKKLAGTLKETDNPVLVVVTPKE